ncbi:hypothetical protein KAR91_24525 [Candidatus Pacearchaeota archaeon]|nr:hypothetical protein [Candidatus Pacearchaeota archaeon]
MSEITNSQDVIDSRDIIARIDELETDQSMLQDDITEAEEGLESSEGAIAEMQAGKELEEARKALIDFNEDNEEELNSLKAVAEECEGYGDWAYGETLISEVYFTEYCMEMLKDIGDLPQDIPSYIAIDEEQTAEKLKRRLYDGRL